MTRTIVRDYADLWLCTDCMLTHANGECGEDPDCVPLSLISPLDHLAMGLSSDKHHEWCTEDDRTEGCSCECDPFSTRSCDGCGSSLHGERHAFTLFLTSRAEVIGQHAAALRHARGLRGDVRHAAALAWAARCRVHLVEMARRGW